MILPKDVKCGTTSCGLSLMLTHGKLIIIDDDREVVHTNHAEEILGFLMDNFEIDTLNIVGRSAGIAIKSLGKDKP